MDKFSYHGTTDAAVSVDLVECCQRKLQTFHTGAKTQHKILM